MAPAPADPAAGTGFAHLYPPARRWLFLAILFLVGTSSAIDRVIVSVLLEPIKHEFHLSDTQLGLLSGLSFAILYSVFGLPIARWADRGDRRKLITLALSIWSAMTMLCGVAGSFVQVLAARIGVGMGEAGATPPAQSLVVDYFPPSQRARAIGILATTGTAGYLIGLSLGSQIVAAYGWRATLLAFGLPGLLIALLVWLILDEPRRRLVSEVRRTEGEGFAESIRQLARNKSYVRLMVAMTLYHFAAYGSLVFIPSYLVRVVGSPIASAGLYYGATSAVAVLVGSLGGGMLCDWLIRRDKRWVVWFPAIGFGLGTLPNCAMFLIDDLGWFLVVSTIGGIALNASLPAAFTAVHAICGNARRATAIAIMLFLGNLLGLGLGPVMTGVISDWFAASRGATSLRFGLLAVMGFTLPTALLMLRAAPGIAADLKD